MSTGRFNKVLKNARLFSMPYACRSSRAPLSSNSSETSALTGLFAFGHEQGWSYFKVQPYEADCHVSRQTQPAGVMVFLNTTLLSWKSADMLRRSTSLISSSNKSHIREYGTPRFPHHPLFGRAVSTPSRRRDVKDEDSIQGGQILALPPWMTSCRPFYKSECKKAFKEIFSGKLKETIFWDQFLDIGCCAGDLTRSIVKVLGGHHRVVVATETSIDAVKVLRRNAARRDILYEVMNIETDVEEALRSWGRFRRIFSFYHLEKTMNKRLALANMRELLIENGELFLLFQLDSNLRPLFPAIKGSEKWKHVAKDYEECVLANAAGEKSTDIFRGMLNSVGFHVEHCSLMSTDWVFATRERLQDMIIATSPFLHRVPPEKREEFIQDCTTMAGQILPNDGGVDFQFSYKTIMVQASRSSGSFQELEEPAEEGPAYAYY